MLITPTYPGVYIQELPSGVRTITGVATSITAFIGKALRGLVNQPVTITSYADYERTFGGLSNDSSMSYAVRDFFQNGGAQAIIVRLYHATDGTNSKALLNLLDTGGNTTLSLVAASEGSWGNQLKGTVDWLGTDPPNTFTLTITDNGTGVTEVIRNVSHDPNNARPVDKVLLLESQLVRVNAMPMARPANGSTASVITAGSAVDSATIIPADVNGSADSKTGIHALDYVDLFNLLCIPPYDSPDVDSSVWAAAATYCLGRRAFLIVDPPSGWASMAMARDGVQNLGVSDKKNAAVFFPRLRIPNKNNILQDCVPCGAVAGIMTRTDTSRGVWKAPAGLDATISGAQQLTVSLTDSENGILNPLGINCLRTMPAAGRVIWGARTLDGNDRLASDWKYIPVRRTALYIEESLFRGTQWVVFEPNDEPLWSQIRLNVGAFMHNLFRQGAFQGQTPREAYFVKCDKETTTQNDINLGIVNILVGFAPLKPAEFVVIQLQQMAGQIAA